MLEIKNLLSDLFLKSSDKPRIMEYCLDNIKRYKKLNAVLHVFDNFEFKSELQGMPILVKDSICYGPTTAGSRILKDFVPEYTATAVARLKKKGANIIAKANCDEFCMGFDGSISAFGPVFSPFSSHQALLAGGSSSGVAAGVAAGFAIAGLGSDTGGSARLPAALNGLVGYRPTYGYISRFGVIAYGSSYDQIGVLARNIQDTRLVASCIVGKDIKDAVSLNASLLPYSSPLEYKPKVAVLINRIEDSITSNVFDSVLNAIRPYCELRNLECKFIDITHYVYQALTFAEAASNLARYDHVRFKHNQKLKSAGYLNQYKEYRSRQIGEVTKSRITIGAHFLSDKGRKVYNKASHIRASMFDYFRKIWNEFDFIVFPTVLSGAGMPYESDASKNQIYSTCDILLTLGPNVNAPSVSIPSAIAEGVPQGFHIMSAPGTDNKLLDFASYVEGILNSEFKVRNALDIELKEAIKKYE